jgi:hypothetical protein
MCRVRCNRTVQFLRVNHAMQTSMRCDLIARLSIDAQMYEVRGGRTFIDCDAIAICAGACSVRCARNFNNCAFARTALR